MWGVARCDEEEPRRSVGGMTLTSLVLAGDRRLFGIPQEVVDAVERFKVALLTVDRKIANAEIDDASAQLAVSAACSAMSAVLHDRAGPGIRGAEGVGAYIFGETFTFFLLSRLLERAFTKPRGYAGDYYTMELVYDNEAGGAGRLGCYIDRWALELPSARAVRNRRMLMARTMHEARAQTDAGLLVTSLASGSARELFDIFKSTDSPVRHATCIDLDHEALSFAKSRAKAIGVTDRITFARDNVIDLAAGSGSTRVPPQDLIYSAGLIDWLQDADVEALLDWMYDHLRPGGLAVLGNFDPADPDRSFLTCILEWPVVYRSEEDLRALFARTKFRDEPVEIRHENAKVQLFAFARRSG